MHDNITLIDERKYQLVFKEVLRKHKEGKEILLEDLLRFYDAKMNISLKRWEDSGRRDVRLLAKSINAMLFYDVLNINDPFRYV